MQRVQEHIIPDMLKENQCNTRRDISRDIYTAAGKHAISQNAYVDQR